MPKRNRRMSNALAKRVSILETKQKADDNNTEYKVSYYNAESELDDSWGSNYSMAPRCTQGVAGQTNMGGVGAVRIGNEINLRYWSLEGYVSLPTSVDGTPTYPLSNVACRIIIADNLTDDTGLSAADVLQNAVTGPQSLISPLKNAVAGGKRYRVHADYKFSLNSHKDKRIKFRLKIPKAGRVLHYDGNSANPSDFNLSLLTFCNVSASASNHPKFNYVIKSRFTDA